VRSAISADTLACTTECKYGFRCLSEGSGRICTAEHAIPGNGVFIRRAKEIGCPYAERTEEGYACSCPTRIELYERFGL
jgi:hypothetical protein